MTCQRLIKKELVKNNAYEFFLIAWHLENIVDEYKDLCNYISKKQKLKVNKDIIDVYKNVNDYFRDYYEIFYEFNLIELNGLEPKRMQILKRINGIISQTSKDEIIILYHLLFITKKVSVLSATIMSINKPV